MSEAVVEREVVRVLDSEGRLAAPERVVDTVERMYRRGQIDQRQRSAAAIYLAALEQVGGGMGSTLDDSRQGGGGGAASCSPTETQMRAARRLADAAALLGQRDCRILALVVGRGLELKAVAAMLFGRGAGRPRQMMVDHVGQRLRLALDDLAEAWLSRGSWV